MRPRCPRKFWGGRLKSWTCPRPREASPARRFPANLLGPRPCRRGRGPFFFLVAPRAIGGYSRPWAFSIVVMQRRLASAVGKRVLKKKAKDAVPTIDTDSEAEQERDRTCNRRRRGALTFWRKRSGRRHATRGLDLASAADPGSLAGSTYPRVRPFRWSHARRTTPSGATPGGSHRDRGCDDSAVRQARATRRMSAIEVSRGLAADCSPTSPVARFRHVWRRPLQKVRKRCAKIDPRPRGWGRMAATMERSNRFGSTSPAVVLFCPRQPARPNGLPSESRQIAQRSPGWTTLPPSSIRSRAAAISATQK